MGNLTTTPTFFRDLIYNTFPRWFREEDTLIDQNGKGLFRRYIECFGDEWDANLAAKLENYLDLTDVISTQVAYIAHLAWFLGNPPDMLYSDARYRKLLRYLMDINKNKGTVLGYEMIFFMLGVGVQLTIYPLADMRYDIADFNYDEGNALGEYRYDDECPTCTVYDLEILDPNNNQPLIAAAIADPTAPESMAVLALLEAIIKYVEPINMRMNSLTYNTDPVPDGTPWVLTTGVWANQWRWADKRIYRDTP